MEGSIQFKWKRMRPSCKRLFYSSKGAIAEEFNQLNQHFNSKYREFVDAHSEKCDCNDYTISLQNIFDAICGMKAGKCVDSEALCAEHFQNAPSTFYAVNNIV